MRHDTVHQQGFVLAMVIVMGVVIAAAAFAVLVIATSKARLENHLLLRMQARLAAEAGIQRAYAQLLGDPSNTAPIAFVVGSLSVNCTIVGGPNRLVTCSVTF